MKKEKIEAIKLREQGFSYNEISSKLKIAKSTLSYWLSDLKISQKAKNRISDRVHKGSIAGLIKRNINQTALAKKRAKIIRFRSREEFVKLADNQLFITGVSLYWAEGYKKGAFGSKWKSVAFTNSDPEMIKLMMRFFLEICKIEKEKIKIQIIAHRNVDLQKAVEYWSRITRVKKSQFIKTCCSANINSKNKRTSNLTHGTVHIRINNVEFFFRMIGWIDGLKILLKN